MQRTISTWTEFNESWDGVTNFLMGGECAVCFDFELPPFDELLDTVRQDSDIHAHPGSKADVRHSSEINDEFRAMPLEQAVNHEFSLAHYNIHKWDAPGQMLDGFDGRVVQPLQQALRAQGFEWIWFRYYFFFAGPNCATNYHMDKSHVIAWQQYGAKTFNGLKDPDRWEPLDKRMLVGTDAVRKSAQIVKEDVLAYEMNPGDVLWNTLLTPHWVEASDEPAVSLNFSLRGLRRGGKLCRHEQELVDWQQSPQSTAGADGSY